VPVIQARPVMLGRTAPMSPISARPSMRPVKVVPMMLSWT
jgi:hypothetical protein